MYLYVYMKKKHKLDTNIIRPKTAGICAPHTMRVAYIHLTPKIYYIKCQK